jgi:hypothetical protein
VRRENLDRCSRFAPSGKEGNGREPAGSLPFVTYGIAFLREPAGSLLFLTYRVLDVYT